MKVLSLPLGSDTGGVTAAIQHAFETVQPDGWRFRSIISTLNYINYDRDMEWSKANIRKYWAWADVVHLHHNLSYLPRIRQWGLRVKPMLLEFHGTGFREDPEPHLVDMRRNRALGVVSTLDLWLLAPDELTWLPCPVQMRRRDGTDRGVSGGPSGAAGTGRTEDLANGEAIPPKVPGGSHLARPATTAAGAKGLRQGPANPRGPMIRIAHAPTARGIKSTQAFLDATDQLRSEGLPIEVDLIEGVSWAECLKRKATADIYFDQVLLGYGNNAIECWGMGIPVVAGAQPATLEEMERRFGELPFYAATEATIYDSLRSLIQSEALRDEYGQRGLEHVRTYHDERVVVELLKGLYLRAAGREAEAA